MDKEKAIFMENEEDCKEIRKRAQGRVSAYNFARGIYKMFSRVLRKVWKIYLRCMGADKYMEV